jgi:hypothetical protein
VTDLDARPVPVRLDRPRRASDALPTAAPAGYHDRSLAERALRTARLAAFFGRLTVKEHVRPGLHVRPLVAELFLTENCNLKCVSCACWTSTTRGELGTEEWCSVIDQLVAARILKVNFTGGEPLIRKDAIGLIAYAANAGVREIHLNTNAIRPTPPRSIACSPPGCAASTSPSTGPTPSPTMRSAGSMARSRRPWSTSAA